MNEHVDYQSKQPNGGTKFLWWCAGADSEILKYSSYSDNVKYVGIGGVVLATGFMAALSMGFAMHTIFDGKWEVTIPIAIIWALIVFNLDRFIVSSTGKGDGTEKIDIKKELGPAIPRLIMAFLLGITISAPMETYIFHSEIEREWKLSMDQLALSKKYEIEQIEIGHNTEIDEKVKKLEEDAKAQQLIVDKWAKAFEEEASGMRGGRGIGPEAKAMKAQLDESTLKLNKIESERDSLRRIQKLNENLIKHKQDSVMDLIKKERPGFLDKIMMLERLAKTGKSVPKFDPATNKIVEGQEIEIYGSAGWPIWLVRWLFIIIEIAPVLLKLMLIRGPSDYMKDNVDQILMAKQGIDIAHLKDEKDQVHKVIIHHNPKRINEIIDHQNQKETENAKAAIDAFAEKEKGQIKNNPDDFIKPTT
jgi:hypothetical protein